MNILASQGAICFDTGDILTADTTAAYVGIQSAMLLTLIYQAVTASLRLKSHVKVPITTRSLERTGMSTGSLFARKTTHSGLISFPAMTHIKNTS